MRAAARNCGAAEAVVFRLFRMVSDRAKKTCGPMPGKNRAGLHATLFVRKERFFQGLDFLSAQGGVSEPIGQRQTDVAESAIDDVEVVAHVKRHHRTVVHAQCQRAGFQCKAEA